MSEWFKVPLSHFVKNRGGMSERLNELVSKTMRGESLTGVQIPLPPQRNKLLFEWVSKKEAI